MPGNPEIYNPSKILEIVQEYQVFLSLLAISAPVIAMAFSEAVRKKIGDRDGWKSVKSGRTAHLEATHINHDKRRKGYDSPSNGRMLTVDEHYMDHYNRHGRNGLTLRGNLWALRRIWRRLSREQRRNLPPPDTKK